jgi:hypothetical protein
MKKGKKGLFRNSKVKQSGSINSKNSMLENLQQLRYKKAFRILPPVWPQDLLKVIERGHEIKQQIETKPAQEAESKDLLLLVSDLATGLWRIDKKTASDHDDNDQDIMRSLRRHTESTLDALTTAKVEIRDHTGEKYVAGMALKVIAFQPTSSVKTEKIAETIKPSVFYKDQLIQRGEVIVEVPEMEQSDQEPIAQKTGEAESTGEDEDQEQTENDEKKSDETDNSENLM